MTQRWSSLPARDVSAEIAQSAYGKGEGQPSWPLEGLPMGFVQPGDSPQWNAFRQRELEIGRSRNRSSAFGSTEGR